MIPPPDSYKLNSDFDSQNKKKGISMGKGREDVKADNFFGIDKKTPAPNN